MEHTTAFQISFPKLTKSFTLFSHRPNLTWGVLSSHGVSSNGITSYIQDTTADSFQTVYGILTPRAGSPAKQC